MTFSGTPDKIKLVNPDSTTGRKPAADVASISLSNEDNGVLVAIESKTGQFTFAGDRLKVDAELEVADIHIGAVEIKDGDTDDRTKVKTDGVDFALVVMQNSQPLPTGAATEATLLAARTDLGSILAGMATAANQGTEIASLASIDGKLAPLGQAAMAGSMPVVIASDQSPVLVAQSGVWNITDIVGTVSLPTGAATEATLGALSAKFNSLGQKVMAASAPVVLASDQVVPISVASLPLPAGAATEATLASVLADLNKFTFSAGRLIVDGSQVTQPVSAVALPLPAGAATAANQVTANASLASIDGKLPAALGQHTSAASLGVVIASDQSAIPVTVSSLPLPTGAATAANQVTANSSLSSIDGKLTGVALDSSLQSILTDLNKFTFATTRLVVDGSQVTQPVSAASLPLPAGAATSALQTSGNASLASLDGKFGSLGQKAMAGSAPVVLASDQSAIPVSQSGTWTVGLSAGSAVIGHVVVDSSALPTGAATETTLAAASAKLPATLGQKLMAASLAVVISSDQSAVAISAASLPLPSGAATSANQVTANGSLSSIDGKLGSLGQKLMAGSAPVVIASDQSTLPVSAASLPLPSGAATSALQTSGNASLTSIDGKLTTTANGLKVDGSAVTQPISAVALPLPTGAATAAKQPALGTAGTPSADVITVQGAASGTPIPVSNASLPLPAGASTSALQTTGNASLASIDGKLGTLGQKAMAGSAPVVIASDQSTLPISAASLPLPAGAATSALQTSGNASLTSIDGKMASLGQKVMTGSMPVVLASDQSSVAVKGADLTGAGSITALNGTVVLATPSMATALIQISGTWVASLQIQGLQPDGTTWTNLSAASGSIATATFSSSAITVNGNYRIVTPAAYTQLRVIATAFTSGSATINFTASDKVTVVQAVQTNPSNMFVAASHTDGYKDTYSAAALFTMAATPTDVFTITGSATRTIRVIRVVMSGTQTTGNSSDVQIIKRSTANTLGTSTTPAVVPHDSTQPAGTAVVRAYTANPTVGTLVGSITNLSVFIPAPQPGGGNSPFSTPELYNSIHPAKSIVLRGVTEVLAINMGGVTVTGNSMNMFIEWTEET